MTEAYDIVIRDAYLWSSDAEMDIAIEAGRIAEVAGEIPSSGGREIDAAGQLAFPGFSECHLHMDKSLNATGKRLPKFNDSPRTINWIVEQNAEYYGEASVDDIRESAKRVAKLAVANGVLHMRSQTYVGDSADIKAVEALLSVREELSEAVGIQVVAFPQDGILSGDNAQRVERAVERGADLIGGIDPILRNDDLDRTVETWFDIATRHDVGIDAHIHEPGPLGLHTLQRIAEATIEHDYQGRVTTSHSYALGEVEVGDETDEVSGSSLTAALPVLEEAELSLVTCYRTTRPRMPLRRLVEAGVPIGLGSDNVRDHSTPTGNANLLEGAHILSYKLDGIRGSYQTNDGLRLLWEMLTEGSATVFGLDEEYGIVPGSPANVVILEAPSPHWAILNQSAAEHVIKGGSIIVEDGEVISAFERCFDA